MNGPGPRPRPCLPPQARFPLGSLKAAIGEAGEVASETAALLQANGILDGPFPAAVMDCLRPFESQLVPAPAARAPAAAAAAAAAAAPSAAARGPAKLAWAIPPAEVAARRDFRRHRIFTVDPFNAKDLDDALHITVGGSTGRECV